MYNSLFLTLPYRSRPQPGLGAGGRVVNTPKYVHVSCFRKDLSQETVSGTLPVCPHVNTP